jgi:hypothetical protein
LVEDHLYTSCLLYGPLFGHNCFPFESYYGDLLDMRSGTHHYQTQLLFLSGQEQMINYLAKYLKYGNNTWQGKLLEKIDIPIEKIVDK